MGRRIMMMMMMRRRRIMMMIAPRFIQHLANGTTLSIVTFGMEASLVFFFTSLLKIFDKRQCRLDLFFLPQL